MIFISSIADPERVLLPSDCCWILMWRCGLSSSHDALGQCDSDRCWPGCRVKESSSLTLGVLSCWGGECPTIWGLDTHTYTRTPAERASGLWGSVILTLCGVPTAVNAKTSRTQTHLTLNGSIIITSWGNSLALSLRRPLYWPLCYFLLQPYRHIAFHIAIILPFKKAVPEGYIYIYILK